MEYLFVLKDKGERRDWWLKITTKEELFAYLYHTEARYEQLIGSSMRDFCNQEDLKNKHVVDYIDIMKEREFINNDENIAAKVVDWHLRLAVEQTELLEKTGCIYINHMGGYHGGTGKEQEYKFVRRTHLAFPQYKEEDIRVAKFEGGAHYYAYIDDAQVHDGHTVKWNTREEAYEAAQKYIVK